MFVDVIGVGDGFVVGFFYGLVMGVDMEICGKMGCIVVGEVICYVGLCIDCNLIVLFCDKGLI